MNAGTAGSDRPIALVLAGSRGLGAASALALHEQGAQVAVCARTQESLDRATTYWPEGSTIQGFVADVSEGAQVTSLVERVTAELGAPGVVVANAGGPPPGGFFELDTSDWDLAFRLTLMSVVSLIRASAPAMRARGFGRIIVLGSSSVRRPLPRLALSNAFRPAIDGIVKDLAAELAPFGITVNMVCPGRIDTERVRQLDAQEAQRTGLSIEQIQTASQASIPAGRYGQPAEIGAMVAFLASEAASFITGQAIFVDGGQTRTLP